LQGTMHRIEKLAKTHSHTTQVFFGDAISSK
jgi:hypothetical protein